MKKLLFPFLFFAVTFSKAQDTIQLLKKIDSTIFSINHSSLFATSHDSTVMDMPALKLYMKTYLTMVTNGSELKKYINKVNSKTEEKGTPQNIVTATAFYFDGGQLIKVEEYAGNGEREQRMEWYYADGKPLHYILTPAMTGKDEEKMKTRHAELLPIAEVLQKKVESKIPKM